MTWEFLSWVSRVIRNTNIFFSKPQKSGKVISYFLAAEAGESDEITGTAYCLASNMYLWGRLILTLIGAKQKHTTCH